MHSRGLSILFSENSLTDGKQRTPNTLGERIAQARREKAARERRDITRADVAKAVGVVPSAVTFWETDQKQPREDALAKLAAYLGVTPAFLRYGVRDVPEIPVRDEASYEPLDLDAPQRRRRGGERA